MDELFDLFDRDADGKIDQSSFVLGIATIQYLAAD